MDKKPRDNSVTYHFAQPPQFIDVLYEPQSGEMKLLADGVHSAVSVTHVGSYERTKKKKIIQKAPVPIDQVRLDPVTLQVHPNQLLLQYDRIFAIDTNTQTINGERVAVSVAYRCDISNKMGPAVDARAVLIRAFEFHNPTVSSERLGWLRLLEQLDGQLRPPEAKRVALVVDSDLDSLEAINSRVADVLDGYILPAGFELVYASADVGSEYWANALIQTCDRDASFLLNELKQDPSGPPFVATFENASFDRERFWSPEEVGERIGSRVRQSNEGRTR